MLIGLPSTDPAVLLWRMLLGSQVLTVLYEFSAADFVVRALSASTDGVVLGCSKLRKGQSSSTMAEASNLEAETARFRGYERNYIVFKTKRKYYPLPLATCTDVWALAL